MSRVVFLAVFAIIGTAVAVLVHRYLWLRLVRDIGLPTPWRQLVTGLIGVAFALMVVGPIAFRTMGGRVASFGASGAFAWMGMVFLFLVAFGGTDLLKWVLSAWQSMGRDVPDTAIDPERRVFFQRALSSSAAAGALLAGSAALHSATRDPKVQRVEVTLDRLPKELDGFKIVQISDLHVSATIKRPYVERVVAMANELAPDLVALTGDLMDGSVPLLRDDMAPIGDLKSTHGSYFCTGNHEYYSGVEPWLVELRRLGVRVLRNERVGVVGLDVAGIDDAQAARFGGDHGPDLKKALAGRNPERPVVLLAHQPKAIDEATEMGVDLVLSGHTHGGQIWPFGFLVRLAQPYVAGLHTHRLGGRATQIYVSRGTGYWGPPMRLGAPHELTLITLRSAEDARD